MAQSETFLGFITGVRIGVDYHPRAELQAWQVGAFVETSITIVGDDSCKDNTEYCTNEKNGSWVSLFGGVRSTYAF